MYFPNYIFLCLGARSKSLVLDITDLFPDFANSVLEDRMTDFLLLMLDVLSALSNVLDLWMYIILVF